MARPSELTQDLVSDAADQLKAQGKKPSPNAVRDIVSTGSFSTIKQMLDVWHERQEQEEKIPVPEIPEFAHRLLEKLHRELYLQNHKVLEGERHILETTRHEFETERNEMFSEIGSLEAKLHDLNSMVTAHHEELTTARSKLSEVEAKLAQRVSDSNSQQIEIATLSEREQQLQANIKEKEDLLKQAEKRELALQTTLVGLSNK